VSDGLTTLLHFFGHDYSWLAQFFSLLVLPFAYEDLAIILGAYIVVNNIMPVGLVVVPIYGGMVASDFVLYGIGAGARHLPWLRRLAVDDRVRAFADMLKRNMFGIVALCRVVPGVVFIAFVACGWTRVPLARFTAASLIVSALYLPLMLCIVIVFGDALDDRVGWWTWPALLVLLMSLGFFRQRVFGLREPPRPAAAPASSIIVPRGERRQSLTPLRLKSEWARRRPHMHARPEADGCAPVVQGMPRSPI
jgi:membrane protein DedA with SNARE-associated domain